MPRAGRVSLPQPEVEFGVGAAHAPERRGLRCRRFRRKRDERRRRRRVDDELVVGAQRSRNGGLSDAALKWISSPRVRENGGMKPGK